MLDVFEILIPENLVLENKFVTSFLLNDFAQTIEIRVVQVTVQDVQMNLLAEFHDFLHIFQTRVIFLRIRLSHQEHLVVLGPALLEIAVLLDNCVYNIQLGQDVTEVVENFGVDQFLERLLVNLFVFIEESIHLIHDILR